MIFSEDRQTRDLVGIAPHLYSWLCPAFLFRLPLRVMDENLLATYLQQLTVLMNIFED